MTPNTTGSGTFGADDEKAARDELIARLDRLPPSPDVWKAVARISTGAFFEIYETALTSLLPAALIAAGVFQKDQLGLFGLPDLASFAFATFAGLFVGALLFSWVSDSLGRKPIFVWSVLWYAVVTLFMAFQSDPVTLSILRFVSAIGVGANIVAIDAYLAEMLPRRLRGRGFAFSKSVQYVAVPVAGLLAALLSHRQPFGVEGWRYLLVVPVVGAVVVLWLRRRLPESPRWLASHGRLSEAAAVIGELEAGCRRRGMVLTPPAPAAVVPEFNGRLSELFKAPLLSRMLMMIVASCASAIAYFGFSNWLPSLLIAQHVEVTKTLLYTTIIGLSYPLAPLLFTRFADRIDRKWQIAAGAMITAIGGLAFAAQTAVLGWLFFGLMVTVGNNLSAYATHTYRAELFPTRLRGRAIGIIYSLDRLSTAFSSYLIGFLLIAGGVTWVLASVAGFSILNMATVLILGPRTRGTDLDSPPVSPSVRGSGFDAPNAGIYE